MRLEPKQFKQETLHCAAHRAWDTHAPELEYFWSTLEVNRIIICSGVRAKNDYFGTFVSLNLTFDLKKNSKMLRGDRRNVSKHFGIYLNYMYKLDYLRRSQGQKAISAFFRPGPYQA